uniref:Putative secreted protein n=1 Tax=Ixodes ricinus TaxID=34613 RepID=A0A6B0U648_IXORI
MCLDFLGWLRPFFVCAFVYLCLYYPVVWLSRPPPRETPRGWWAVTDSRGESVALRGHPVVAECPPPRPLPGLSPRFPFFLS